MGRGGNKRRGGGGRGRGGNKRGRGGGRGGRGGDRDGERESWAPEVLENKEFERYYKAQNICPEEEWPELLEYMKKQLPITFRINGSGRFAESLIEKLSGDFLGKFSADGEGLVMEGQTISPPKPLPWYPNNLAWQLGFSRRDLRRIPEMKPLHEFIKAETEMGAITRQEAVSMIPPLFLDVHPHHRVLDMCAAPGSKTFQMLEALHDTSDETSNDAAQRGLVVGNDADSMRCATLTHQAQRMRSPALVVTNHEAQNFPTILDCDPTSDDGQYMWDRILCDVPCSGDGTMRKCPDIWGRWTQNNGNGLHLLQLKIALRAAEILKVGGRMVYSTCTFNPVEDEAVVAELLRRTHGGLRLVDVSAQATELKFRPGLSTWKVMDGRGDFHESWETAQFNPKMNKSMFPKGDEAGLGLDKTMRFLPHYQDTGGFFVAVLEKTNDMPPLLYPVANRPERRKRAARPERAQPRLAVALALAVDGSDRVTMDISAVTDASTGEKDDTTDKEDKEGGDEPTEGVVLNRRVPGVKREDKVMPEWGPRNVVTDNKRDPGGDGDAKPSLKPKWKNCDPIMPYGNADMLKTICEFYGIAADSPVITNLMARSFDPLPRKLVYLGHGPKLFLQMDTGNQLKTINAGLKLFERQDSKGAQAAGSCRYRISQEGIHVVFPFMTKQLLYVGVDEFTSLLRDRSVFFEEPTNPARGGGDGGGDGGQQGDKEGDKNSSNKRTTFTDPATVAKLSTQINGGCCVVLMADDDLKRLGLVDRDGGSGVSGSLRSERPFLVPCWKGRVNLGVMASKIDCDQMLDMIATATAATAATGMQEG